MILRKDGPAQEISLDDVIILRRSPRIQNVTGNNNPKSSANISSSPTGSPTPEIIMNKIKLPDFDTNNPELWFAAAEVIFGQNGADNEQKKFSSLLQNLDAQRLGNIHNVIMI